MQTKPFGDWVKARAEPTVKNALILLLCLVVISFSTKSASAQPASLDTSFDLGTGSLTYVDAVSAQPDGKIIIGGAFTSVNGFVRNGIARLDADGSLDTSFNPSSGVAGGGPTVVLSLALQTNGQVVIGGDFTSINGASRGGVAQLDSGGNFDGNLNSGTGLNPGGRVYSVALQSNGKAMIGGGIYSVNGTSRYGIARLNGDGSLDITFDPGSGVASQYSPIYSLYLQADGKVLVGGDFSSFNGVPRIRLARLNADGSLDTSFDPGSGVNDSVRSILAQPDGKVIIVGNFTTVRDIPRNRIARLNNDGTLDASFDPGTGADSQIQNVALQPDGKMIIAGGFTRINGTNRNGIARLSSEGRLDLNFDPGSGVGASHTVYSVAQQVDGKISIGGDFTSFNGVSRNHIARLNGDNPVALTVTSQPANQIAVAGSNATFNVKATGFPFPTYRWQFNEAEIPGATNATLLLSTITAAQSGSYRVLLSNSVNSVVSDSATLTVLLPPGITAQPPSQTVNAGDNVSFSLTTIGTAPLAFQWKRNGSILPARTNSILTLTNVQGGDAGNYTVLVGNSAGSVTSSVAILTVRLPPVINSQPLSQSVIAGSSVSFTVLAAGTSPLFYQWQLNGVAIDAATNAALVFLNVQAIQAGSYSVSISNLAGTVTSSAALLTVLTPPSIILQPQSQVVAAGADVAFTVVAAGMQPLRYQWMFQGGNLMGATNSMLVLTNVQSGNAGNYSVRVSNDAGSVFSTTASLSIPSGTQGFVIRTLLRFYSPGSKFVVTLQANPSSNTFSYAVEEQPPAGWLVGNITANGTFDANTHKIKWGLFFDNTARTLTYEISPPTWQTGTNYFFGIGSDDGVITTIGGENNISDAAKHPADISPSDWAITIGEISAYGTAWKKGSNWGIGPNPIPVEYVTRSGYLWKNGEQYRFDPSVSNAPLWWVTMEVGALGFNGKEPFSNEVSSNSLFCTMSPYFVPGEPLTLQFRVVPFSGVAAYAVQDQIPAGWAVSNMNFNGEFDAVNNQIKWGPFFDDVPRQLLCQITPDARAAGLVTFSGVGSFDGANVSTTGQRQTQDSSRLILEGQLPDGRFLLDLHAHVGGVYLIQVSTNLLNWRPLMTVTNYSGTAQFTDESRLKAPQQFYRAVEQISAP